MNDNERPITAAERKMMESIERHPAAFVPTRLPHRVAMWNDLVARGLTVAHDGRCYLTDRGRRAILQ